MPTEAEEKKIFPGADERTPSRSEYFSWINNTNEGSTEEQTLINLAFFAWLREEYGMILDIYAFDSGNIDGARHYGSDRTEKFKRHFPRGFAPIYEAAKKIDTKLGLWGGPDGFGEDGEFADERTELMTGLVRDYGFTLFKFDGVCGGLPPKNRGYFVEMMKRVRGYNPDFILLNHRLDFGEEGMKHATTKLFEGAETYIDVHMANNMTASHNRAVALTRGLPPDLGRLYEDHGVCISSCNEYWADDLILQAFNRCLILAPQIYGNPWLLPDRDYPKLARIFNLHRAYRDILVNGIALPDTYGENAVSRGDSGTRFVTLRNMSWDEITIDINLDETIGLSRTTEKIELRLFHPSERLIGRFAYGERVSVPVLPFRSALIGVSSGDFNERAGLASVEGCDFELVRSVEGKSVKLKLFGMGGDEKDIIIRASYIYKTININGIKSALTGGEYKTKIKFGGTAYKLPYHRKICKLKADSVPADAAALYEASCFAGDSNAFEVRALKYAGETNIPEVKAAREAFFSQQYFRERGIWDKYLFDGDGRTGLSVAYRIAMIRQKQSIFRLDLGRPTKIDRLVLGFHTAYEMEPLIMEEGMPYDYSADLVNWKHGTALIGLETELTFKAGEEVRFIRINLPSPNRMMSAEGFLGVEKLNTKDWRASNLFNSFRGARKYYEGSFSLPENPKGSYICIAVNGRCGTEGAYAALRLTEPDGSIRYIGAPSRAPSYPSNHYECVQRLTDGNLTYYIPVTDDMVNKKITACVVGFEDDELKPEVYISAYPIPFEEIDIEIE